uniref:Uncharacterized protein n=1 Tax=viral metagenome TaxID=1070528 RepID=A0A6M3J894_9ZZZZ
MANGDYRYAMLNAMKNAGQSAVPGEENIGLFQRLSRLTKGITKSPAVKGGVTSLMAWMALNSLLGANRQRAERGIHREAIRAQGESMTPENLYYQAALPAAQMEEETARQALFAQISGGVLGPSLARGERILGR